MLYIIYHYQHYIRYCSYYMLYIMYHYQHYIRYCSYEQNYRLHFSIINTIGLHHLLYLTPYTILLVLGYTSSIIMNTIGYKSFVIIDTIYYIINTRCKKRMLISSTCCIKGNGRYRISKSKCRRSLLLNPKK